MKFRTTGLLLVIFVVLIGYVYFVELRKKPADQPVDKSTWVLTLAQDDVQQLNVNDQGNSVLLFRSGDQWQIGAIGGSEADAARVNSVIASLVELRSSRVLTQTAEGLAAYGLEKPGMTVTLVVSEQQQDVLLIGNKNPGGSAYYVQKRGQTPVHLVYSALVDDLKRLVSEPPYKPTPTPESVGTPAPGTVEPARSPTQ
jgi:hypothetical protein